ncbi:MAG: outer membrane protein assembly factor BamA [Terriglobales bacterium]
MIRRRFVPSLLVGLWLPLWAAAPAFGQAKPTQAAGQAARSNVVAAVECFNNHRIPCATILAHIYTHPGMVYDPAQVNRDFNSLWNTGFFDNLVFKRVNARDGVVLQIWVTERPIIRNIKYLGLHSITESDILDRYEARNVHLDMDGPYDPTVAKHAVDAIKELLGEHGRQYANVQVKVQQLPPSSVALTFVVNEGPKVKVGKISFTGNRDVSSGTLEQAMKNLRPIGIPHSLIFEHLFAKTYGAAQLSEDLERVREAMQDRGYFEAVVEDPTLKLHTTHSRRILFFGGGIGKQVDIHIPIVEGEKYYVGKVQFLNSHFITNTRLLDQVFGLQTGEVMDVSKIRKGLSNLRKLYGEFGYINFVANPDFHPNDKTHRVAMNLDVHEGKPFFIHRIEFTGNTTTRDKVIRRALMVQEGQRFNTVAWKNSLLRLNQLGYFSKISQQDVTMHQNTSGPDGEVDIDVHVHEKGKNTIGLTGGVSGIAGSFLGLNYSTNNLLGLGETLSVSTEYGSLQNSINFSFTEPYVADRPIQLGFSVYHSSYHYDQAKEASILYGENLVPYFESLGGPNGEGLLNYLQDSTGFTVSTSTPTGPFTRLGLTYGYDVSHITPLTTAATVLFSNIAYVGVNGPQLTDTSGIVTSRLIPSFTYNTVNSMFFPTAGHELELEASFAGIGGNVRTFQPTLSYKYFHKAGWHNVFGFRLLGSIISGYGGGVPPSFDRFYIGGEQTIRGFDLLAVTPIAEVPSTSTVALYDPTQPCTSVEATYDECAPLSITVPSPTPTNPTGTSAVTFPITIPTYTLTTPGGDTEGVGNFDYRIPIVGPVYLVPFLDVGVNKISFTDQLRTNPAVLTSLQNEFCSGFLAGTPGLSQCNDRFPTKIPLVPGTNSQVRMSTGLELEVMMPVIHQPFRVYYAINPLRVDENIQPPALFTKQDFLNQIPAAYQDSPAVQSALAFTMRRLTEGAPEPFKEAPDVFRFTIGTTF